MKALDYSLLARLIQGLNPVGKEFAAEVTSEVAGAAVESGNVASVVNRIGVGPLRGDVLGCEFGKFGTFVRGNFFKVGNNFANESGFDFGFGLGIEHDFAPGLR